MHFYFEVMNYLKGKKEKKRTEKKKEIIYHGTSNDHLVYLS